MAMLSRLPYTSVVPHGAPGLQTYHGPGNVFGVHDFPHSQQWPRPSTKGNTFANTAEAPRCEAGCVFAHSIHGLSKAEWALVDREVCILCVASIAIRGDLAETRLPANCVPHHISVFTHEAHGAGHAPTRLVGAVSHRPDIGRYENT